MQAVDRCLPYQCNCNRAISADEMTGLSLHAKGEKAWPLHLNCLTQMSMDYDWSERLGRPDSSPLLGDPTHSISQSPSSTYDISFPRATTNPRCQLASDVTLMFVVTAVTQHHHQALIHRSPKATPMVPMLGASEGVCAKDKAS